MSRHEDPHYHDENLQAEAVSADRPPQFNSSTCGYRCGWGCCEPLGGDDDSGGYGSDGAPTLVGSIGSDDGEDVDSGDLPEEVDALSPGALDLEHNDVVGPIPLVLDDPEDNILLSLTVSAHSDMFSPDQSEWEYQGSVDSLENHAASEAHSSAASDRRSIGSASPCRWDAVLEVGAWNERVLPGYFCVTPLRLSPQYEHCRGSAASHMIIQDFSMLLEPSMEEHNMRMFAHGFPFQSAGFSCTNESG